MKDIEATDPSNGQPLASYPATTDAQLQEKLQRALSAQKAWAQQPMGARAEALRALARALRDGADTYAECMTREMGKPISAAKSEVEKCAWVCEFYAEKGPQFLADQPVETEASRSFVAFRPLGLVFAVMPWNYPFWQFFRCAAPALMAGNGMLLKHASNVPGSARHIEAVSESVPALAGLIQTLLIDSKRATELIGDPAVAAVTLTGSTGAGRHVAGAAGKQLKKCVMELGGSDPYVVLGDADVQAAAEVCVTSRMTNNGQSCIAAKRFIAVASVYDAFCDAVVQRMGAIAMGDPMDPDTKLGPMARADLRDELHDQVQRSIDAGARLRVGGKRPDGEGAYYPATVLSDVTPGMPAFDEELFGPVAAVIRAADEADALRLANQSEFGLGGAILGGDSDHACQLAADQLQVGCAFVNTHVRSDPRLPFGGIKDSGFGRELGSFGIHEFVNIKTVYVK